MAHYETEYQSDFRTVAVVVDNSFDRHIRVVASTKREPYADWFKYAPSLERFNWNQLEEARAYAGDICPIWENADRKKLKVFSVLSVGGW